MSVRSVRFVLPCALTLVLTAPALAQNRAVDTDGAIDLTGAVVLPSRLAVLLLALAMVLVCLVGALLAQRSQERRAAEETRRRLEERLAAQEEELSRLRQNEGSAKSNTANS